jgi:hypothetical protein
LLSIAAAVWLQCYAPNAWLLRAVSSGAGTPVILSCAQQHKEEIMFKPLKTFARALRAPSVQEREMAYLNESHDAIELEYRMRQVDRGMFRKGL